MGTSEELILKSSFIPKEHGGRLSNVGMSFGSKPTTSEEEEQHRLAKMWPTHPRLRGIEVGTRHVLLFSFTNSLVKLNGDQAIGHSVTYANLDLVKSDELLD
jgi:hypothetical protein